MDYTIKNSDLVFVIQNNEFLVYNQNDTVNITTYEQVKALGIETKPDYYLGVLNGRHSFVLILEQAVEIQPNYLFQSIRQIDNDYFIATYFDSCSHAMGIVHWDQTHQYCSACGEKLVIHPEERSKICNKCDARYYPKICPAVIIAILKDNQILLAHNDKFRELLYCLVAGFVEACVTLEACVWREIYEEVGILVDNIRYFNSQPWPFPNSLMMGFIADYKAGEIKVDGVEITDAQWFNKDNLPNIPKKTSIAGKMIRLYLNNQLI
jgi:NAD+ diphosphatase